MGKTLMELKNIYKIYNLGPSSINALNNVSLEIKEGECTAIIGDSGSGKSTLMNILGCLDTADKGSYFLDGNPVSSLSDQKLSHIRNEKIGFIFQNYNLIPTMNAYENIELPLIYRKISEKKRKEMVLNALRQVKLLHRLSHLPSEMSGGQQQRVAIARAIAAQPPVILADEPTGNLDHNSGLEILTLLKELWQAGKTLIIITHDEKIARQCTRNIHVFDGEVINDSLCTFKS